MRLDAQRIGMIIMMAETKINRPITNGVANVPVVMQMEATESGAVSLAMILAYYGRWIPLEQMREDCGVSRDGSNVNNIMTAAKNHGLTAQICRLASDGFKGTWKFPMIVQWRLNHFVVLNGFRGNKVYVNDPARGNVTMTREQFDEGCTGSGLLFEPSPTFELSGRPESMVEYARSRLKGATAAVTFVAITTLIGSVCTIMLSGFSRVFIDRILTGYDAGWLMPFIIGLSALAFLHVAAAWLKAIYSFKINGKMAILGNMKYMWRLLRLPMRFFSQRMAGDIQQRQESNAKIAETLVNTLSPLVMETLMLVFYLAVMLRYSPMLTHIEKTRQHHPRHDARFQQTCLSDGFRH